MRIARQTNYLIGMPTTNFGPSSANFRAKPAFAAGMDTTQLRAAEWPPHLMVRGFACRVKLAARDSAPEGTRKVRYCAEALLKNSNSDTHLQNR
jgi:hypothetical protein